MSITNRIIMDTTDGTYIEVNQPWNRQANVTLIVLKNERQIVCQMTRDEWDALRGIRLVRGDEEI